MLCEECQKRPATVHFTKIVNGKKIEKHLCKECAQKFGEFGIKFNFGDDFSISNLLGKFFETSEPSLGIELTDEVKCPFCGMTFSEFSKRGKFGCSQCYTTFNERIDNVLKRIHGSKYHTGKVPKRTGGKMRLKKEIMDLKQELQKAVEEEAFEKAAEIRDKIKALKQQLEQD